MSNPTSANHRDALLKMASRGLIRTRDLNTRKIPRVYLSRMVKEGVLEQVDRGVYQTPHWQPSEFISFAEVAARSPKSIVALLSALAYYELTTEIPHAVWILLPRNTRKPQMQNLHLEVITASGVALTHGVHTVVLDNVKVKMTTPAKTVADCFRYRSHVGLEVALSALRDYLRRTKDGARTTSAANSARLPYTVDALMAAAKADQVARVIKPYVEAML